MECVETTKTTTVKKSKKVSKKVISSTITSSATIENGSNEKSTTAIETIEESQDQQQSQIKPLKKKSKSPDQNGKKKSKKSKKGEAEKENISVKSSFSKFDALQKKHFLHVRSSDADKAQEKFSQEASGTIQEKNCHACGQVVYSMEEIKAEKCIWHRTCFKCNECAKKLNVDTYQSHEGILYCKMHFRNLFAPKVVENSEPEKPKKPELIIRENQPVELPPDVARASDKPSLGLEELQQLNVRQRFQVFERSNEMETESIEKASTVGVKRSASLLSRLAKFQAKSSDLDVNGEEENEESDDGIDEEGVGSLSSSTLDCRFAQMEEFRTKFENPTNGKEERREVRKQELQNIRSRLFLGKQARIKEMYQQAVADSEHNVPSSEKKNIDIDVGDKARSLKEKFENGEIFNEDQIGHQLSSSISTNRVQDEDEMAVFESGIGKKSRSIFMELDASAAKNTGHVTRKSEVQRQQSFQQQTQNNQSPTAENVVKCNEKADDVKIQTSEISSAFKFFETYKPNDLKKKEFRITPPRDGVVKMPCPDDNERTDNSENDFDDPAVAKEQHTTTKMLSRFREMEQMQHKPHNEPLKPLKCFTPPPEDSRRVVGDEDDEEDDEGEEEEEEDSGSDEDTGNGLIDDESLRQIRAAARAKVLREKFERWEAGEIQRESIEHNNNINGNSTNGSTVHMNGENVEDNPIESTRTLREKFENMKELQKAQQRPQHQVNRFV